MPLPEEGNPISADDLNEELGNSPGTQIDFESAAISLLETATRPHGMDEFYGASLGEDFVFSDWDGSVSINEFGIISVNNVGNAGPVTINTSNFSAVTSSTPQSVNVTITAPSEFDGKSVTNAGELISGNTSATQPAVGRYLSITADDTSLAGDDTSLSLTVTDTYYDDTPWEITTETISDNTIPVVSFLPITGTGTETVNLVVDDNPNGSTRNIRFRVTGTVGGKSSIVDVSQASYTPVLAPTIAFSSISPSGPYPYNGIARITYNISRTNASSFSGQIYSRIGGGGDGNNAVFSSVQPSGITYNGPTSISGTGTIFYVEIPARDDGEADTKESILNVSVSTGGGFDDADNIIQQEGFVLPTYTWGGSVSIPRNTGVVNVSGDDSAGTITLSPSSFGLVTSQTTRTVVVGNIVIPSGYQNAGTAFSQTFNPIQDAADELISISSSTGGGVSGQGENFTITVDTTDIYSTQWEGFITYTDQSNSTNWVQLSAGNTGTGDDEFFVFVDPNYAGSNGYDGTTRYFDIRVDKVGGGVSSNTLSFIQNVGTPPVIAPSVSVSPTSRTWTYSQSGTSQYQTITAYHDGGNAPTSVSFYVSGIHYGLVQHDPNVPVNTTGGPWVAQATSTSGVSSYSVGVYPLTQNDGTSNKEETVTISMGNSGGTTPVTAQMIQGFNIDWETNVSSLSFGTGGGTQSITLTTDLSWTATVSGTGFSINTTSGTAGTRTISVTATQKDLGGSGTVTFSASGQSDIVVSLSQAAAPLEWYYYVNNSSTGQTNSARSISISYLGGSTSIGVYAYRGTTAQSNQFTLTKSTGGTYFGVGINTSTQNTSASNYTNQNQGASAAELYINFDSNSGNSFERTASVQLSIGGYSEVTFTVTQNADPNAGGSGGGDRPDPGDQV